MRGNSLRVVEFHSMFSSVPTSSIVIVGVNPHYPKDF